MNPAISLLLALAYALIMAFKEHFFWVDFLPLVFLMLLHRGDLWELFKRLVPVQLFALLIALGVGVFHQDWEFAVVVFVRSSAIVSFNLLLFWKKDMFALYQGMEDLRIPSKLSLLLFFMMKYVWIFRREFEVRMQALKARGFVGRTDMHTYKTYAGVIGMMIYHGFLRAERLQESLIVRGVQGRLYTLHENKTVQQDYVLGGLIFLQLVMLGGVL